MLRPDNEQTLQQLLMAHPIVYPVGGRTKPALCDARGEPTRIDMRGLSGMVEYEPDEFTFTARAGTAVTEIAAALAEKNQYLPFDPLLVDAGATLGGTVAANTSGSGRLRYGGVRDFILGVRFVDGNGRLLNGGGKVVKNAAGFDIPKLMVGSLGRLGIFTELTFKVFPKPATYETLHLRYRSLEAALEATFLLANQPYELDAVDIRQDNAGTNVWLRMGGQSDALPYRLSRLISWLESNTAVQHIKQLSDEGSLWRGFNQLAWTEAAQSVVKIPLPPRLMPIVQRFDGVVAAHFTTAGNVAWVTTTSLQTLDGELKRANLAGLVLRGRVERPFLGELPWLSFAQRVKQALDPAGRFLPFEA